MATTNFENTFSVLTYNTKLFSGSIEYNLLETLRDKLLQHNITEFLADKIPVLSEYDELRAAAIVAKISELQPQPDLICLQEAWGKDFREGKIIQPLKRIYNECYATSDVVDQDTRENMAKVVAHQLKLDEIRFLPKEVKDVFEEIFADCLTIIIPKGAITTNGLVVLSRSDLVECKTYQYDRRFVSSPEDGVVKKGFAVCRIESPINLTFTTTHMPTTPKDIYYLLRDAPQSPAKMILGDSVKETDAIFLGDLNLHYYTKDERSELKQIMAKINPEAEDLPAEIEDQEMAYTDLNYDKERIDYVYFARRRNKDSQITPSKLYPPNRCSAKVLDWSIDSPKGKMTVSDHRPVLATFDINRK